MKSILLTVSMVGLLSLLGFSQSKEQLNQKDEEAKIVRLKVTGLSCAGCANHLHKVLKAQHGVLENHVEYPGDIAVVTYNPNHTKPKEIIEAIEDKTTYKVEVVHKKKVQ